MAEKHSITQAEALELIKVFNEPLKSGIVSLTQEMRALTADVNKFIRVETKQAENDKHVEALFAKVASIPGLSVRCDRAEKDIQEVQHKIDVLEKASAAAKVKVSSLWDSYTKIVFIVLGLLISSGVGFLIAQ